MGLPATTKLWKKLGAWGLALWACAPAWASSQWQTAFQPVPEIPRAVVARVVQDAEGFLWVGTGDGLARWDGYRLQPMEREGPDALARNMGWVRAMAPGSQGRLWIGTEAFGLAVWDAERQRIEVLGGVPAGVLALLEAQPGEVWIGTLGSGLWRYQASTGQFSPVELPGLGMKRGQVNGLALDPAGTLWVAHWQGLSRRPAGASAFEAVDVGGQTLQTVKAAPDGTVWFGAKSGQLGRLRAGAATVEWAGGAAGRSTINALALGSDGKLWVGHRAGIDFIEPKSGRLLERLQHQAGHAAGLPANEVTTLWRDATGAMWVGGFGVGLLRHMESPALRVRGPDADPTSAMAVADARALLQLQDGRVLAAAHSGTVAVLDADLKTLGRLPREGAPVEAMAQDARGQVWLASAGSVEQREPNGRLVQRWPVGGGAAMMLRAQPDGSLWLGAQQGLFRWQPSKPGFVAVPGPNGPIGSDLFALEPDGEGGLWVGGLAGLYRWRMGAAQLEAVAMDPQEGLGVPVVLGLLRDRKGQLWVDTAVSGLHRLIGMNAKGQARFERVSVSQGVAGRPFGANLHEDARGRIWSQQFVYDPTQAELRELRAADGALFGTAWFRAHTRLADGSLLFAGSRGLLRVEPDRYEPSTDRPPIRVTDLRVEGKPYRPERLSDGLKLAPGTRSFSVYYAALDFGDPQRLRYRHRLLGYETDWTLADATQRSASYGLLPPGNYTLEVEATNRSGVWSPERLSVPVTVQPAWWQRGFVQALLSLGLWLSLWGLLHLRTRHLRRREQELQALVDTRTAELREASLTDPLTGLHNRRYLALRLSEDLRHVQRQHHEGRKPVDGDLLVFLIDIDHFKQVNDRYGHTTGDHVLQETAMRLRPLLRETDTLVRWGGEEFLVLARDSSRSHGAELAARIVQALNAGPVLTPEASVPVTASVGWSAFPPDPNAPEAWDWEASLQLADSALYAAKAAGRNTWLGVAQVDGKRPGELNTLGSGWTQQAGLQVMRPSAQRKRE